MKKLFYILAAAMTLSLSAGLSSCEDVPAPYKLNLDDVLGGGTADDTTGLISTCPFSVPDAITAFKKSKTGNFWVKGYIVGYVPTGGETSTTISNTVFGTDGAQASNIVLAASATEVLTSNCMVVQLQAGELRNALNLKDHAENLGQVVNLYGSLEKYFGGPGLKGSTCALFKGDTIGEYPGGKPDTIIHITIKEFLEKKNPKLAYELTGVASGLNPQYASFDLTEDGSTVYIYKMIDATGATASFSALNIEEGDTVTVTGKYLAYTDKNGNVKDEINPATFVKVKKCVTPVEIEHIAIADFLEKKDAATPYELTGIVKNIVNTTYGNFDLVEVDGEASVYIYGLLDATGAAQQFANLGIAEGDTLTLTGRYKDYNGKAEIANAKYVSHKKGNDQGGGGDDPVGESITLDFTTNTWGLPEGSANGVEAAGTYTNGTYSFTIAASAGFKYYFNSSRLMLGKEGAYLTLPAFDFAVARIDITGASGASGAVKQNLYVGETAVSTQTVGATATNKYEIAADYQAAGNQYTLKVESAHNTQISKIVIYKATEPEQ